MLDSIPYQEHTLGAVERPPRRPDGAIEQPDLELRWIVEHYP